MIPVTIEPPRFGLTGPGFVCGLQLDRINDALTYALDAPPMIACGSVRAYLQTMQYDGNKQQHYLSTTTERTWP